MRNHVIGDLLGATAKHRVLFHGAAAGDGDEIAHCRVLLAGVPDHPVAEALEKNATSSAAKAWPRPDCPAWEEWFTAPACDGFVLAASHTPGAYDDVVRLLVPELQPRGLFQKDYAGPTLHDNLGLAIPRAADWRAARR
jgi:hypothetical protein